jgi:hypothetical protein
VEIPDLPERSIFMVFMAGNDNQKFYSSLQFAPKAKTRNHYAGDGTAFLTFDGEAIQQALDVNLRAYSYVPDSTPASVTLTEQTEAKLGEFVHPFSVISVDVVQVLKEVSCAPVRGPGIGCSPISNNDAMLTTLNNTYGITGSLASNADGDRITGQYIWFHYRIANDMTIQNNNIAPIDQPVPSNIVGGVTWSPDFIMGKSLQYGDYAGPFVTLAN